MSASTVSKITSDPTKTIWETLGTPRPVFHHMKVLMRAIIPIVDVTSLSNISKNANSYESPYERNQMSIS